MYNFVRSRVLFNIIVSSFAFFGFFSQLFGYAAVYEYAPSYAVVGESRKVSHGIGVQRVYSDLVFKSLVLNYLPSVDHDLYTLSFNYGKYYGISDTQKYFLSFGMNHHVSDRYALSLACSSGYLRRLSSRVSSFVALSLPYNVSSSTTSVIVSAGLHYFYGSGIEYREGSKYVKRVKKRFLWFFWIDG